MAKALASETWFSCYLGSSLSTTTTALGHTCGAISRSGDYQYKGSGGQEIDPGLEAGS